MKTIIISCNYNEGKSGKLEKCLLNLAKNKLSNTIICVIDNASKDNSKDIIKKFVDNNTIDLAIVLDKNIGKAKALNTLFRTALNRFKIESDDLVLHLDSDVSMYSNFIEEGEYCFLNYNSCELFISLGSTDPNNFKFDNYHQFDLNATYNCQNSEYSYMPLCPNICGYIWTMKVSSFINVNLYRENLGKNGMSAIYGGDDGLLLYDLLIYFYRRLQKQVYVYMNKNKFHWHTNSDDQAYIEWKQKQNKYIQQRIFNNDKTANDLLSDKGFYDD